MAKLQRLQNHAARIVTRNKRHNHITRVLEHLYWLSGKFQNGFKILLIVFKALNGFTPEYISELLAVKEPTHTLRSGGKVLLVEPINRLAKMGDQEGLNSRRESVH